LAGDKNIGPETHTHKGFHSTMGQVKGSLKPVTTNFIKKASGRMGSNALPESKNFIFTRVFWEAKMSLFLKHS
jgi:phenylalanine-4-hydroxylase